LYTFFFFNKIIIDIYTYLSIFYLLLFISFFFVEFAFVVEKRGKALSDVRTRKGKAGKPARTQATRLATDWSTDEEAAGHRGVGARASLEQEHHPPGPARGGCSWWCWGPRRERGGASRQRPHLLLLLRIDLFTAERRRKRNIVIFPRL
jgi:hypothetical protein